MEKEIKIKTPDKHMIYGKLNWKNKTDQVIIFVHGLSAYIDDEPFYNASRFFPKNGFATARISLYSHEKNARKLMATTIHDNVKDIETAVKHFKKQFQNIYLIGHSLGGSAILLSNTDGMNGIVLWEPSNPDSTFEETLIKKKGFIYTNWGNQIILNPKMVKEWIEIRKNVFSLAQRIQVPMKIICGDKEILWKKWEKYFKTKHRNQEFTMIPNAGHCFYEEGTQEKLFRETLKFLKKIK